ncbi:hypothetical protein VTK26DRAFT_9190 [Humicola hyalothermophila]
MATPAEPRDLGLSILGLGTQYPPYALEPSALDTLSKRFYPDSPAMQKVLSINRYTGIDQRSSIGTPDHPLVNQPHPPTIAELHRIFMSDGVPLAVSAARKALAEARVDAAQVTHMVSTTCTDSANPGYDHFVAKQLGLNETVEKVLLHGVGCSGGLAALRTAANLCLGHSMRRLPARILVVALEISSTFVRSELESINALQETRIGVALFSDCASAALLSNDIPFPSHPASSPPPPPPIYSLLAWNHRTVPETDSLLGFDVDPVGWKVVLSPSVPKVAQSVLLPSFTALLSSVPPSCLRPSSPSLSSPDEAAPDGDGDTYRDPADFDWAMHPGGATILAGAEQALGITPAHMRASYDRYVRHGNSSSATVLSVLDRLREREMDELAPPWDHGETRLGGDGGAKAGAEVAEGRQERGQSNKVREYVVGCAFGPGITVEMCLLRRNLNGRGAGGVGSGHNCSLGVETPPETESETSGGSEDGDKGSGGGSERGNQARERGGGEEAVLQGRPLDSRRLEEEQEAFISKALEEVELD